jgi:uncharacterized membrane protein
MSDSSSTPQPPSQQWDWLVARLKSIEERLAAVERRLDGSVSPPVPEEPAPVSEAPAAVMPEVKKPVFVEPAAAPPPSPSLALPKRAKGELSIDSLETLIGKNWASWLGGAVLLLGVCFFLKYAWDQGWIRPTPAQRVMLAVALGVAISATGEWMYRKKFRAFAATLHATAIAIIMAALWGANVYFDPPVMGRTSAFIAVALTAAGGIVLALRVNVMTVALLSFAGAYLSPFILSSGQDKSLELLTYLAVIALAGWIVSLTRAGAAASSELSLAGRAGPSPARSFGSHSGWLPLRWFIFLASVAWFALWWNQVGDHHRKLAAAWVAFIYLGALSEAFASDWIILKRLAARGLVPESRQALTRPELQTPILADSTIVAISLLLTCATFAAYWAILRDHPREYMGFVALTLALIQATLAFFTPSRQLMWCAILQATGLVTLSIPLFFDEFTITLAWLAMAVGIALLGWQLNFKSARAWAVILLLLAIVRVGIFDSDNVVLRGVELTINDQPITRWLLLAWGTAIMCHLIAWLRPTPGKWPGVETWSIELYERKVSLSTGITSIPVLQYQAPTAQRVLPVRDVAGALLAALGTAVFYFASELLWFGPMMTLLIIAWTAPILLLAPRGRHIGYGWHALWLTRGASIRWLIVDNFNPLLRAWENPARDLTLPFLNLQTLSVILICLALLMVGRNLKTLATLRWPHAPFSAISHARWLIATTAAWIALLLFAYVNFETWRTIDWLHNRGTPMRDVGIVKQVAMSVLWAVIGLGAVIVGFRRNIAPVRYTALVLLAITLAKILIIDMADVQRVWRILSFIAVGALLLAVSYVYHKHIQEEQTPG